VNDAHMKRLNSAYLGVDRTTDVLSFPIFGAMKEFPRDHRFLLGDIVINPFAARRQSAQYDAAFEEEIRRLLIHGFLHLLGYDHEKNCYQERKMRKEERRLLHTLETLD
jgi:probable rRNA maturation factor